MGAAAGKTGEGGVGASVSPQPSLFSCGLKASLCGLSAGASLGFLTAWCPQDPQTAYLAAKRLKSEYCRRQGRGYIAFRT